MVALRSKRAQNSRLIVIQVLATKHGGMIIVVEMYNDELSYIGKAAAVHDKLRRLLTHGAFGLGEHLQPNQLADLLKVSVTPVREALARLAVEGLILAVANHGYFTKRYEVADQKELYELGVILLKHALEKSIAVVSADELKSLIASHFTREEESDTGSAGLAETRAVTLENFYRRIVSYTGNSESARVMMTISGRTHTIRVLDLGAPATVRTIGEDLSELLDALSAEDAARAIATLDRQFEKAVTRLSALVERANQSGRVEAPVVSNGSTRGRVETLTGRRLQFTKGPEV